MKSADGGLWTFSWVICRLCGHRHMAVYPCDIIEEENQECPRCRHMTCEPEDDDQEDA
jgi:hypothetical protein